MEKEDIVLLSFQGKDLSNEKIFDETKEKPVAIILGHKELLPALEEQILPMSEGEERKITLKPEQAFGERKAELVRVIPLQEFKARNLSPYPGMIVELNELIGKVQSVSGGRVRVDFNHELAGKSLEYKIKIEKVLKEKKEQVQALLEKYFPKAKEPEIEFKEKEVEIKLKGKEALEAFQLRPIFSSIVIEHVQGIEKVKFIDEFEKKEEGKTN